MLISGVKLVREVSTHTKPLALYTEENTSENVMKKITGLSSPEGVAAEFPLPKPSALQTGPLLVLDRLSDPGNVGTLIRTAIALGWAGIYFMPGTVDPFHEKVVRASRAALFRFPWQLGSWEELKQLKLEGYVADIGGTPLDQVAPKKEIALVLSNEGQGVSDEGQTFGERITIPMHGEMESLNVAISGAILMYALGSVG